MSVLTTAEALLLRTHPQQTKLWLSIDDPPVIFQAMVSGSYNADNQSIGYYNRATGSFETLDTYSAQVVLVGTAQGGDEKGRTWLRSGTSQTMRFVESDHIDFAQDDWLTVIDFSEIIPVFPRIINDPDNADSVIFYKAYDIGYIRNWNSVGVFINMGPNHAEFVDEASGDRQVYFTASGTSNLYDHGMTYLWSFPGGTPTGSTAHTPGWVTYPGPGRYKVKIDIESDGWRHDTSIRYVNLYDKSTHIPTLNWEFLEASGQRANGGYRFRVRARDDVTREKARDGALVTIFSEDWYGDTKQSIGGNAMHRNNIFANGYILEGSITHNYRDGWVEFDVGSPSEVMKMCEGFAISVKSSTDPDSEGNTNPDFPSPWVLVKDMDIRKAIYHYLNWHTSVPSVMDISFVGTDQAIQYFEADRTSIYDAINTLMSGALLGTVVCDNQGKLIIQRNVEAIDNAAAALPVALSLTNQDWIGDPVIDERAYGDVSFIEMGGIAYAGPATDVSDPLLSQIPGNAPGYRGKLQRQQGLALADQDDLNTIAGNVFANRNKRYPNIDYRLNAGFRNLGVAPLEQVKITMGVNDTPRGISWNEKGFAIQGVSYSYDGRRQQLITTLSVEEIVQGFVGDTVTIPIPDEPPTEGDASTGGGSFDIPPIDVPPLPVPIPTPIIVSGSTALTDILSLESPGILDGSDYVRWTSTIWDGGGLLDGTDNTKINLDAGGIYYFIFASQHINGGSGVNQYIVHEIRVYDSSDVLLQRITDHFDARKFLNADSPHAVGLTVAVITANTASYVKCLGDIPNGTMEAWLNGFRLA